MFYEAHNSLTQKLWKPQIDTNLTFPSHLHSNFEFITIMEGTMQITVDKNKYTLNVGDAMLIFPNQVHSLDTESHSQSFLCIFSPQLVQAYSKVFLTKLPQTNMFRPDGFYTQRLIELSEFDFDYLKLKGILYSICGEFNARAKYRETDAADNNLLHKIFHFVDTNYNKNCSLCDLALHTSYHQVYLSRYFQQCIGITFTEYVNRYRINEACYILKNSSKTVLEAAYDCGFGSLRSFNRNFKEVMGVTPSEFRKK